MVAITTNWAEEGIESLEQPYFSVAGFNASEELIKLQKGCYAAYPDGLIKGYHKGRTKAYNKCMEQASTTINNMVRENTKLVVDTGFNQAVSALGAPVGAQPETQDNTAIYVALVALLLIGGGGVYYWLRKRKTAAAVAVA